ncbi:Ku protein [Methylocella silvestris BL2]|uniref:Non-homologous end joining protein Ku n=1 Tax=Methylocella silvestris (strain DSM 15510 / CIP 108128 / LMG 27833 / NCIMB 13906 / BL2) TaxID=395965 RepID=KU_METSB|nr:Ku protein [Methylocella silvestris]B8EKE1.1 RecName: Full=Non-homologous end joining protein Ku [Methylocella silvestris BL2]ACK50681.1 Ku protein [Methylocella silvestris BL2]
MAPRSFWKGYLKLSLVTCPVVMAPAKSEKEKLRFHTLNRATGNRVQSRYIDSVSGKPVDSADQVKGFPRDDQSYVMLEDEELDSVALESARTIDIELFAPADSIDWIWYDAPHYLTPGDEVGEEAFAVIREAMKATKMVGISRLVLYRRERAVLLEPRGKGIILWTLRYGDEVRDPKLYFDAIKDQKPVPELLSLVNRLIEERVKPWSPEMASDPVQDRLRDIIEAKKTPPAKKTKAEEKTGKGSAESNVIDIMDALRKSLGPAAKKPKGR